MVTALYRLAFSGLAPLVLSCLLAHVCDIAPVVRPPIISCAGETSTCAVLSYAHVVCRERMTPSAVCLVDVLGNGGHATKNVYSQRHRFQVLGVDTCSVPAQMVECQSAGNRANEVKIGVSVSRDRLAATTVLAVAAAAVLGGPSAEPGGPFPALSLGVDADLVTESFGQLAGVHLAFLTRQSSHGEFNDACLGDAEAFGEGSHKAQALGAQPVTCGEFGSHR